MPDARDTGVDAYRPSEVARLRTIITEHGTGLAICGISGAGGIGKSYLVDHVLASLEPAEERHILLRVDAANPQARGDFFALIEGQLARRSLPPPADSRADYFPQTRRVAAAHRDLVARVGRELERRDAPEDLKRAAVAILKAAHYLNKTIPKTREYVDIAKLNLAPDALRVGIDGAWDTMGTLKALRESEWLPGPLRDRLGMTLSNRVKRDLYNVAADALLTDLSAALHGYQAKDRLKVTHGSIRGVDRLLLVVDDYEALAAALGDFFVGSLVPRLAAAQFPSVLVVACRDDLEATHPGWGQHCRRFLVEQIRLRPFDAETAAQMMASAGVAESRRAAIYELTQGFPFLLSLAIEEATADGASALFLRKFFDRTTRWMSRDERDWFTRICFLDEVNEDTLALMFPEEDVGAVQDWFEGEASIRDPAAPTFRVRPLIREKVLRYIEVRSPARHRELLMAARRTPVGIEP